MEVFSVAYNHRLCPMTELGYAVDVMTIADSKIFNPEGKEGACIRITLLSDTETNKYEGFRAYFDNGVVFTQPGSLFSYWEHGEKT